MIDKDGAHCDRCPNHEESDGRDFKELVNFIKLQGWKIFKLGSIWLHHCPACNGRKSPTPQSRKEQWYDQI